MNVKTKAKKVVEILLNEYPNAETELNYSTPLELLIATILSAQCTDARVNMVTEQLFAKYKTLDDYANADISEFEQDIFSTGFYKAKAKNILNTANIIKDKFGGEVPQNMEDLLSLSGVGRKTANCVLGSCFGIPGIVVDTHVSRLSNRIGFTTTRDPLKAERELMEVLPRKHWIAYNHIIIQHGRRVCKSQKPDCPNCIISQYCDDFSSRKKK